MNYKEQTKRYILFIISLFFSALGVAFTKHGELGVSPISSVANVVNCKFPAFSLGTLLIVWNCVLILGQILLLQNKLQWEMLLRQHLLFYNATSDTILPMFVFCPVSLGGLGVIV